MTFRYGESSPTTSTSSVELLCNSQINLVAGHSKKHDMPTLKVKFLEAFLYTLCIALVTSTMYDMSFAFLRIAHGQADAIYTAMFVIMALMQSSLMFAMFYTVWKRFEKIAGYLGKLFFFAPLLIGALYAVTDNISAGYFWMYFLPMFHRISGDVYELLCEEPSFMRMDQIWNYVLTFLYGAAFMWASRAYKRMPQQEAQAT